MQQLAAETPTPQQSNFQPETVECCKMIKITTAISLRIYNLIL